MDEIIKTFTLRLSPEQHRTLEERANAEGVSKNQYIIKLIEGYEDLEGKLSLHERRLSSVEKQVGAIFDAVLDLKQKEK